MVRVVRPESAAKRASDRFQGEHHEQADDPDAYVAGADRRASGRGARYGGERGWRDAEVLPGQGLKPIVQTERRVPDGGQQVTTGALQILEVLFPDGTSLTLSPNSDVTVDAFSYGDAGGGRLALSVNRGLVRIAGGAVGETTPITVKTALGEVKLDAASAVIEVDGSGRTRVSMLAGHAVQFVRNGQTQTLERPGFELVSSAQTSLNGPSREPEGGAATDAFGLGTAQLAGLTQRAEDNLGRAGIAELAAIGANALALTTENQPAGTLTSSGLPETPLPTQTPPAPGGSQTGGGPGGFSEIGTIGGLSGSAGFGAGSLIPAPPNFDGQPSASTGLSRSVLQSRDANILPARPVAYGPNDPNTGSDAIRPAGPTTNRLFMSSFTEAISGQRAPVAVPSIQGSSNTNAGTRLQYVFLENDPFLYSSLILQTQPRLMVVLLFARDLRLRCPVALCTKLG